MIFHTCLQCANLALNFANHHFVGILASRFQGFSDYITKDFVLKSVTMRGGGRVKIVQICLTTFIDDPYVKKRLTFLRSVSFGLVYMRRSDLLAILFLLLWEPKKQSEKGSQLSNL